MSPLEGSNIGFGKREVEQKAMSKLGSKDVWLCSGQTLQRFLYICRI